MDHFMTILSFPFLTCYSIFVLPIPKYYNYTMSDHFVPVVPQRRLRLPLCGCGCWPASPVVGCSVGGVSHLHRLAVTSLLLIPVFLFVSAGFFCWQLLPSVFSSFSAAIVSTSAISGIRCTGSAPQLSQGSGAPDQLPRALEGLRRTYCRPVRWRCWSTQTEQLEILFPCASSSK